MPMALQEVGNFKGEFETVDNKIASRTEIGLMHLPAWALRLMRRSLNRPQANPQADVVSSWIPASTAPARATPTQRNGSGRVPTSPAWGRDLGEKQRAPGVQDG